MSKESFITTLSVLIVVIIGVSIYYMASGVKDINVDPEESVTNNSVVSNPGSTETTTSGDVETNELIEYSFTNDYGDGEKSVTIQAKKCEKLTGFAGANSNVFYIDWENKLHYLELVNLEDKVLATNIVNFDVTEEGIIAYYENTFSKVMDNDYVTYSKNK